MDVYIIFMMGVGMLLYGSFLILFVGFMIQLCNIYYKEKTFFTLRSIVSIAIGRLLFFVPTVLWIWSLKYAGVYYYSHEIVQYRQLVWMIVAISISVPVFVSTFYDNVLTFFTTIPKLYLFVGLFVITLLVQKVKTEIAF